MEDFLAEHFTDDDVFFRVGVDLLVISLSNIFTSLGENIASTLGDFVDFKLELNLRGDREDIVTFCILELQLKLLLSLLQL